jgi:hypothetical protein
MTPQRPTCRLLPAFLVLQAALLGGAAGAAGQTVTGQVVDAVTGEGVEQASVEVMPEPADPAAGELVVATDSAGWFTLSVPAGSYTFRVQHVGYETLRTPAIPVARGELVTIEIRLGPRPIEIEPLLVRARGRDRWYSPFHQRLEQGRAMGQGRFITREDIERRPAGTVNDLLAAQPGLRLVPVRGSTVVIMTGRGQNCRPMLYFDGVPLIRGAGDVDLSHWFQPHMIEGIEIYASDTATPADMRGNGCGVIAIWSRGDPGDGPPLTWRRVLVAAGIVAAMLILRAL